MDHFPVVGVQGCLQGNQNREPPGHLRHVTDFVGRQAACQEGLFAVGKPLLDDLVTANRIVPHCLGYVPPAGELTIQVFSRYKSLILKRDVNCFRLNEHLNRIDLNRR